MLDYLFLNANVADGTGTPMRKQSVGVKDGKICAVCDEIEEDATQVIQLGEDEVLCPGFIDSHAHSEKFLYYDRRVTPKLLQGVTTEISGNCGLGLAPYNPRYCTEAENNNSMLAAGLRMPDDWEPAEKFSDFLKQIECLRPEINTAFYVAHGALRIAVKGYDGSPLNKEESEKMDALLREAMEAGAIGLTTGMVYVPGSYASHEEVVHLCSIVKEYNGIYATHMRDEGERVVDSVKESIDVARKTGVTLLISHHKVTGVAFAHLVSEIHKLVRDVRKEGLKVYLDQYPYNCGASTLSTTIPYKYMDGGVEQFLKRLEDPEIVEQIRYEILHNDGTWQNALDATGFDGMSILTAPNSKEAEGKNLQELSEEWHIDPVDVIFRLLRENNGFVFVLLRFMKDETVEEIFQSDLVSVCTDSILFGDEYIVHPRGYATYPRVLGKFVREKKLLPLEEAIRKMTSMPADMFSMTSKGRVQEGMDADIVVFNRETIIDAGDYVHPRAINPGISYVMVGGEISVDHGKITDKYRGTVMRRGVDFNV